MGDDFRRLVDDLLQDKAAVPEKFRPASPPPPPTRPVTRPPKSPPYLATSIPAAARTAEGFSSGLSNGRKEREKKNRRRRPLLWTCVVLLAIGALGLAYIGPDKARSHFIQLVELFQDPPPPRQEEATTKEPAASGEPEGAGGSPTSPPIVPEQERTTEQPPIQLDADQAAWESAQANGRLSAFLRYIKSFPEGEHYKAAIDAAQARIRKLRVPSSPSTVTLRREIYVQEMPGQNEARAIYRKLNEPVATLLIDAPGAGKWFLFAGEGNWPFRFAPEAEVRAASADVVLQVRKLSDQIRLKDFYPERALASNRTGVVRLSLSISEAGDVTEVRVLHEEPDGWGFGAAAVKLASQWRFEPRQINGISVATTTEQSVVFSID